MTVIQFTSLKASKTNFGLSCETKTYVHKIDSKIFLVDTPLSICPMMLSKDTSHGTLHSLDMFVFSTDAVGISTFSSPYIFAISFSSLH